MLYSITERLIWSTVTLSITDKNNGACVPIPCSNEVGKTYSQTLSAKYGGLESLEAEAGISEGSLSYRYSFIYFFKSHAMYFIMKSLYLFSQPWDKV